MKQVLDKYSNSAMTLLMLAIFLVLVGIASRYPAEARFMPFVVGIPAILLCLVQLWLDARKRRQAAEPQRDGEPTPDGRPPIALASIDAAIAQAASQSALPDAAATPLSPEERVRRERILWGYFLGFIGGILLFGFWAAIPVFLVGFLRFQAKSRWTTALLLGLGASVALYLVFERGLKVQLHRGFVVGAVLERLDVP